MRISYVPVNSKFGDLTVIDNSLRINGRSACLCRCSCGNITTPIPTDRLKSGNTKSCGCLRKQNAKNMGYANKNVGSKQKNILTSASLVGCTYGELTVKTLYGKTKCRHLIYECVCTCGNTALVTRSHLLSGTTKSCGCLRKKAILLVKQKYRLSLGHNATVLLTPLSIRERIAQKHVYAAIKIRDNFTCKLCGQVGGILHTHHIIPFATNVNLRNITSNLVTLCKKCHLEKAHDGAPSKLNVQVQQILLDCLNDYL